MLKCVGVAEGEMSQTVLGVAIKKVHMKITKLAAFIASSPTRRMLDVGCHWLDVYNAKQCGLSRNSMRHNMNVLKCEGAWSDDISRDAMLVVCLQRSYGCRREANQNLKAR